MTTLPEKANEYIQTNFIEGYVTSVLEEKQVSGAVIFKVNVEDDTASYHLEFNSKGDLINYVTKPIRDEDYYEGEFYGEDVN